MNKKSIGERIKLARKAVNLTQEVLSKRADATSKRGLQDNEAGKSMPGGAMITALVDSGINANWLLTGEGPMLLSELLSDALQNLVDAENLSKTAGGMRVAQNPNFEFDAALKRVAEATQATVRISKGFDFALPVEWSSLIQELMAIHGLTEAGAKRVIEALKQQA